MCACRFEVAQNLIVDAERAGDFQQRIADGHHIEQILRVVFAIERVEIGHDGIGQEDGVAAQELHIAQHRPARGHLADNGEIGSSLCGGDAFVDEG